MRKEEEGGGMRRKKKKKKRVSNFYPLIGKRDPPLAPPPSRERCPNRERDARVVRSRCCFERAKNGRLTGMN